MRVGSLVFTTGQTGIDPATGVAVGETFEAQGRQALTNLRAALMLRRATTTAGLYRMARRRDGRAAPGPGC